LSLTKNIALTKELSQSMFFCIIMSGPVPVTLWCPWDKQMFLRQVGRGLGWSEGKKWVRGNKKRLCQKGEEINTAEGTRFQFILKQHG